MNAKKRAMSAEKASKVKKRGHYIEHVFAEKINGRVQKGDQKSKKDVIDLNDNTHSVKRLEHGGKFFYTAMKEL